MAERGTDEAVAGNSAYTRKRDDGSFEAVHHRLIGIASREDKGSPPRITCQGMGRVEAMLEGMRRRMSGFGRRIGGSQARRSFKIATQLLPLRLARARQSSR
jgi:hypothetical protein